MKNYNLIWDFDGNLYDTYPLMMEAYKATMDNFGVEISDEELLGAYKFCKLHSFKSLFAENEKKYDISAQMMNEKFHQLEEKIQDYPDFFDGADDILKETFESGNQNFLLTHRDTSAIKFLENDSLSQYFTDYVTSENNFKRKPNPESIDYLLSKYDLNPEHTYMIGDRDLDLLAGVNASIRTIYYNVDGFNDNKHADYVVNKLIDIHSIVKKQD